MKLSSLALALGVMIVMAPAALSRMVDDRTLSYGCDDLVVVGRVQNGEWRHVNDPDDILGHGWVDATLKVRRVIKGIGLRRTARIRYFAHTYMRDDHDFMLVRSRKPDGSFVINTGQLMSAHPRPAARCD